MSYWKMEQKTIRVGGVPEHFNTPWYQINEEQPLQSKGITVSFSPQPGGTGQMATALRNNELDVAVLLTEGITANILKGDAVKIVKVYVNSPLRWGVHVSAESKYNDVNDIDNKRFAISRLYSGSHLMAHIHAHKLEKKLRDEQFEIVGNLDGAITTLTKNKADYFLWEKFTTQPYVSNGTFRRIGEVPTPWPCFVIAVREEFLSKNEIELSQLIDEVHERMQTLEQHEESTIQEIAKRFNLEEQQVSMWFNELEWNKDFELPESIFQDVIQSLLNVGIIEERHVPKQLDFLHALTPTVNV